VKFHDRRPTEYSRDAIGGFGKTLAAIAVLSGAAAVALPFFWFATIGAGTAAGIITAGVFALVAGVAFLVLQKHIAVDAERREIRVEVFSGPLRRLVVVYPFDSAVDVVLYSLSFGAKKSGILYACAIRTNFDEMIIFNPGLRDPEKNGRIANALAEMLGVKVVAGRIEETPNG